MVIKTKSLPKNLTDSLFFSLIALLIKKVCEKYLLFITKPK